MSTEKTDLELELENLRTVIAASKSMSPIDDKTRITMLEEIIASCCIGLTLTDSTERALLQLHAITAASVAVGSPKYTERIAQSLVI